MDDEQIGEGHESWFRWINGGGKWSARWHEENKYYRMTDNMASLLRSHKVTTYDFRVSSDADDKILFGEIVPKYLSAWSKKKQKDLLDAMVEILPWHKNDTESAVYAKQGIPKNTVLGVYGDVMWSEEEEKQTMMYDSDFTKHVHMYAFDVWYNVGGEEKVLGKVLPTDQPFLHRINSARGPDFSELFDPRLFMILEHFDISGMQTRHSLKADFRERVKKMKKKDLIRVNVKMDDLVGGKGKHKEWKDKQAFRKEIEILIDEHEECPQKNVEAAWIEHEGMYVVVFYTSEDIMRGEELLLDYGDQYWNTLHCHQKYTYPSAENALRKVVQKHQEKAEEEMQKKQERKCIMRQDSESISPDPRKFPSNGSGAKVEIKMTCHLQKELTIDPKEETRRAVKYGQKSVAGLNLSQMMWKQQLARLNNFIGPFNRYVNVGDPDNKRVQGIAKKILKWSTTLKEEIENGLRNMGEKRQKEKKKRRNRGKNPPAKRVSRDSVRTVPAKRISRDSVRAVPAKRRDGEFDGSDEEYIPPMKRKLPSPFVVEDSELSLPPRRPRAPKRQSLKRVEEGGNLSKTFSLGKAMPKPRAGFWLENGAQSKQNSPSPTPPSTTEPNGSRKRMLMPPPRIGLLNGPGQRRIVVVSPEGRKRRRTAEKEDFYYFDQAKRKRPEPKKPKPKVFKTISQQEFASDPSKYQQRAISIRPFTENERQQSLSKGFPPPRKNVFANRQKDFPPPRRRDPKWPKQECPLCGLEVAVTPSGKLRSHRCESGIF